MRATPTAVRRLLALTAAVLLAVVVAAIGAAPISADPVTGTDANGTYLALGDSVAFGFVPADAAPAPNYEDAHSFLGYPEFLAQQLNERVTNASCPGETSTSMLVAGAPSNGCENLPGSPTGYRTLFPLHAEYQGTQMEYALHYLAAHQHTRLVTLGVGANDLFLCAETTPDGCRSPLELLGVATAISTNLTTMFQELRGTGYQGPIVVLTYYSLSYTDPAQLQTAEFLRSVLESATSLNGGIVADGFDAFAGPSAAFGGDPCAAGLLIKLPDGTCNIHPSPAGQRLLTGAIAEAIGA